MADLKKLAEELVNLTVLEVNELSTILKDEYGIEPAAAAVVVAAGGAGEAAEEQSEFDVILKEAGASKLAVVMVDFQMEQYLNSSSTYGAPTTMTLGVLRSFYLNGTTNYLFSDDSNNPPVYLKNRPGNNTFRVRVITNDAVPVAWTDNAGTPVANGNYILCLSFQEV